MTGFLSVEEKDHPHVKLLKIEAEYLRRGDLLHVGGTNFVLVAAADVNDTKFSAAMVIVTVYDGDVPLPLPTLHYAPADPVQLAGRNLDPSTPVSARQQEELLRQALLRDMRIADGRLQQALAHVDRKVIKLRASGERALLSDAEGMALATQEAVRFAAELEALRKALTHFGLPTTIPTRKA